MVIRDDNVPHRSVWSNIVGSLALLAWSAASGSFIDSLFVCPIWFLISVVKNAVQLPGWTIALVRAAIPVVTLAIVLANYVVQSSFAKANAERVVSACEQFRTDQGMYPQQLDELVPGYLGSVPRAKYCLIWGNFRYFNNDEQPSLVWVDIPPFGRRTYNFQAKRWGYLD